MRKKFVATDILLPYQKKWIGDEAKVKVVEKSRRTGFSWAEACADVLLAASTKGMDVYYISYNFEFTKEFIQTCTVWAKSLNEAAAELGEELVVDGNDEFLASKITFPSGHKIMGLPARATTIRGRQGKIVIDEAAFCENLDELIKAAMAMLIWGGKVSIISTHNGDNNLFNEIIGEIRAGQKDYSLHRTTITDALNEGLYKRICQKEGEKWTEEKEDKWLEELTASYGEGAAEELFCIPSKGGARYISQTLVENCQSEDIPVFRYEQTTEFTHISREKRNQATDKFLKDNLEEIVEASAGDEFGCYLGIDFARSGDLTVAVLSQKVSDTLRVGLFNLEMRNVPFDQQDRVFRYILNSFPHIWGVSIDARGNGQMIAEGLQQDYGVDLVNSVMITTAFYAECMPELKRRLESKEILMPKSIDIIEDFRLIKLEKGIPKIPDKRTGTNGAKYKLRHGDTAVAECMIEHAMKNDNGYQVASYESVKVRNPFEMNGDDEWEDDDEYF